MPDQRQSEPDENNPRLAAAREQARERGQGRTRIVTPEQMAELKAQSKARVANNPDYYPEDPDDPAMTPPPLDDNGDEIPGGH